ncbi:MAG TPA: gamma-glutamyltransferase [Povalibacter sp.]|uniref:gamma-glutamyltransferase n=1 Tax=Povalibacter sp. TaxID=1962978 RepID=UPI002C6F1A30|nr:gamma-glutamyltransferase [Povalibacter sp.]HMN46276.1 gamma-glutamyltransferase [Povalibacter sp.]
MKHRSRFVFLLVALVATTVSVAAGMQPERAENGMVASVHVLASQAGVDMMKAGGNAIDAAVATGFALAVVHPSAGNIGGGGFMLIRTQDGQTKFIDFREKAPGKATATMYQDKDGNVVPSLSRLGYLAVGVPGSVKGLVHAQAHYGKLTLKQVMAPAIRLAREGYVLDWSDARQMSNDAGLAQFADSKRIFQNGGKGWKQGDVFRQPDLARTLERIVAAPDDFYTGRMARELAEFMQRGGGLITVDDLRNYDVKERTPVRGTYRGLEVISAPPPSSGGIALIETLNILEGFDIARAGFGSAESIHLISESYRRAFYDRAQYLGDPEFSDLPVLELADKPYAVEWRKSIDPQRASVSSRLERPRVSKKLEQYANDKPVKGAGKEPTQTTHYSVVDKDGNAVAVTTTLNGGYGSKVTAGPLGFLLNNEMDDFSSKPGAPNMFGLLQSEENAVGPNKRPLSAMTPTIVLKDGKLWLVLGSPGGPTIITTVANILIGVADFGLDIQQAVNAPRFHHQWVPDRIIMERNRFSPDTIRLLEQRGHAVSFGLGGDGECIQIDLETGLRLGASDGRNDSGRAVGY